MKLISKIVYEMQCLTVFLILDLQEHIYKKVISSACQHVVGFKDLSIDVFLEVQNERYSQILYLIDYIAYGLHLWYEI